VLEGDAAILHGAVVHNKAVAAVMKPGYTKASFHKVEEVLEGLKTLEIKTLDTGLPQAAEPVGGKVHGGYEHVWTRDSVCIALAYMAAGQFDKAAAIAKALIKFYSRDEQMNRMLVTINENKFQRPDIKFNGKDLVEMKEGWNHAQNDALGLFLWLTFRLAR